MTTAATAWVIVAGVMAIVDWVAVAWSEKKLEYVAKPAATVALLAVGVTLDASDTASQAVLVAALVFCLAGDVFLMLPRGAFVQGLGAFAVAQMLFAASFIVGGLSVGRILVGALIAVAVAIVLARRFVGALRRTGHHQLVVPVCIYVVVISAMGVAAVGGGTAVAIAGAALFLVSDSLIAETRFVTPRPWQPTAIMVTYHLALAGLVFGLL